MICLVVAPMGMKIVFEATMKGEIRNLGSGWIPTSIFQGFICHFRAVPEAREDISNHQAMIGSLSLAIVYLMVFSE
jgi:hypothetical protein